MYLELLATEQAPGWTQAVSREITGFLRSSVTAAWRHGWQPAELARHVGRELSDGHASMAADVIADKMRGYAAGTVDGRWAGQVTSLGAGVWWGSDAEYLGAWQARQGTVGRVAVATAIELLHLPVLEQLGPLPRAAHAGSSPVHGDADERILGKIRALHEKAESTEFPQEAEALSARAQELIAKYSIDHAVLASVIPYRVRDPHRERLSQATEQAEQQAGTASSGQGLLPVLRARQQAVDDAVGEMFGGTLASGRAVRTTDAEGWYSGRAAADMATLHNHSQVTA